MCPSSGNTVNSTSPSAAASRSAVSLSGVDPLCVGLADEEPDRHLRQFGERRSVGVGSGEPGKGDDRSHPIGLLGGVAERADAAVADAGDMRRAAFDVDPGLDPVDETGEQCFAPVEVAHAVGRGRADHDPAETPGLRRVRAGDEPVRELKILRAGRQREQHRGLVAGLESVGGRRDVVDRDAVDHDLALAQITGVDHGRRRDAAAGALDAVVRRAAGREDDRSDGETGEEAERSVHMCRNPFEDDSLPAAVYGRTHGCPDSPRWSRRRRQARL